MIQKEQIAKREYKQPANICRETVGGGPKPQSELRLARAIEVDFELRAREGIRT